MSRILLTIMTGVGGLSLPCAAQDHSAEFNVPFEFVYFSRNMLAGIYQLSVNNDVAELKAVAPARGRVIGNAPKLRPQDESTTSAHLHFLRTQTRLHLHLIEIESHRTHVRVPKSADQQLARYPSNDGMVTIVAHQNQGNGIPLTEWFKGKPNAFELSERLTALHARPISPVWALHVSPNRAGGGG